VGFAAKLEGSNSIDRAFHVQLLPLDHDPSALCRTYTALRGTTFAFTPKNIGISRHKSGGAALISEMPDAFQSRWISLWDTQSACAKPAENWNFLKEHKVILDRH
jgi:hypothetical protein